MRTSLYRDLIFSASTSDYNPQPYFIYTEQEGTIFNGKAWRSLADGILRIDAGRIFRDYMSYPEPRLSVNHAATSTVPIRGFSLMGSGDELAYYQVIPDRLLPWNGESRPLSNPINGKMDARMRLFFSYVSLSNGQIAVEQGFRDYVFELDGSLDFGWEGDTRWLYIIECSDLNAYSVGVEDEYAWLEVEAQGDTLLVRVAENRDDAREGRFYVEWLDENFNPQRKYFEVTQEELANYSRLYLTVESVSKSPFALYIYSGSRTGGVVDFKRNDEPWSSVTIDSAQSGVGFYGKIPWNSGDTIQLRHNEEQKSGITYNIFCSDEFDVYGNILSMSYGDDFVGKAPNSIQVSFAGAEVRSAKNLYMPEGQAVSFRDCTHLTEPPTLPENTSFGPIFAGCTRLVNAPSIPSSTRGCYAMFSGCTSLVNAPELTATALTSNFYISMFAGCTRLVNAPALPATVLASRCYESMFEGCTSLVNAPVLPAETMVERCYYGMFNECTSLSYIKCLATNPLDESGDYTYHWVRGVAFDGTFVQKSGVNWYRQYDYEWRGIPEGWTVQEV